MARATPVKPLMSATIHSDGTESMSDEEEWIKDVEHDDPDEAHELASMIAEEADDEPQDVPFVTHDSFEKFANSKDLVMVQYGAPWCPWSRRMEPVWKVRLHRLLGPRLPARVFLDRRVRCLRLW